MSQSPSNLLSILRGQSVAHRILSAPQEDLGLADFEPYPFLAIEAQEEMKLALLLSIINPLVGGVLLIGSRGTAKTTAVRSLVDLLPTYQRSLCPEGCTEELLDTQGLQGICDDCAKKVGYGEALTSSERIRILELPLNARLEDVVGNINERLALEQQRLRLEKGILAQADGQILYIDEINLLGDEVTDAILDAAAQGFYTVRRGPINLQYRSKFLLIGSMNPEEGRLRPQIMDRFGLRAIVRGLADSELRFRAYERAVAYMKDPENLASAYADQTMALATEIQNAQARLTNVNIGVEAKVLGLNLIHELKIDSSRAEIALFEAARAHAAADDREVVVASDIKAVAFLALRMRVSNRLSEFFRQREAEDDHVREILAQGTLTRKQVLGDD